MGWRRLLRVAATLKRSGGGTRAQSCLVWTSQVPALIRPRATMSRDSPHDSTDKARMMAEGLLTIHTKSPCCSLIVEPIFTALVRCSVGQDFSHLIRV